MLSTVMLVTAIGLAALAGPGLSAGAQHDDPAFDPLPHLGVLGQRMMEDPLAAPAAAQDVADRLLGAPTSLANAWATALEARTGEPTNPVAAPPAGPLAAELALAWAETGQPLAPDQLAALEADAAALDAPVERALAHLVAGARVAEHVRGDIFADVTPTDLHGLVMAANIGAPYEEGSSDRAQLMGPGEPTDLLEAEARLAGVDVEAAWAAHAVMAAATDAAMGHLVGYEPSTDARAAPLPGAGAATTAAAGDVFTTSTPYGTVAVSSNADHTYTEDYFVLVELGGSDTYNNHAGAVRAEVLELATLPVPPPAPTDPGFVPWTEVAMDLLHRSHNASVLLDLDGNDLYAFTGPGTQGYGGFGGFGALVDLAGTDTYRAGTYAQGAGQVAGAGFLVDLGGNDVYVADRQAQGFGQDAGAGLLLEGAGDDRYQAYVIAQGTGWSANVVGALVDVSGNDDYTCTGIVDFSDSILPVNAPRPGTICHAAGWGGTGVLVDGTGDDAYQTALGFHAMTLIGTGVLVDGSGQDTHTVGEWSTGVGVLGAAVVVDGDGPDTYTSNMGLGIPWADIYIGSNGEGYLGVGVMADGTGDDTYTSSVRKDLWLVQYACGAGCSYIGGTGVLIDGAGNDVYTSEVGQGGAFVGTSLLADASGDDTYRLTLGTRGQGYAETDPLIIVIVPIQPSECQYGILWDGDGRDSYNNPVTDFGARADDRYWGQNDFGRGMDALAGTAGYLTSAEFQQDLDTIMGSKACENLSGPGSVLLCQLTGVCLPPLPGS